MSAAHSKHHSNRETTNHPVMEALEGRRLLSADLAPLFASQLPVNFNPGNANRVAVDVLNDGNSTAAGPVTVDLFAEPVGGGAEVLLAQMTRNVNLKADRAGTFNF